MFDSGNRKTLFLFVAPKLHFCILNTNMGFCGDCKIILINEIAMFRFVLVWRFIPTLTIPIENSGSWSWTWITNKIHYKFIALSVVYGQIIFVVFDVDFFLIKMRRYHCSNILVLFRGFFFRPQMNCPY